MVRYDHPYNDAIPLADIPQADTSIEFATYKCQEFYEARREASYGKFHLFRRTIGHRNFIGINTWYIGEGGQGVVHGCETLDPASTLKQVAVKAYKNPILVSDKIIRTGKFTV